MSETGDITTDFIDIKSMIKEYHKQIYANKFNNLDEMDKPLEKNKNCQDGFMVESIFLPFPASGGYLHFLAPGPLPSSKPAMAD